MKTHFLERNLILEVHMSLHFEPVYMTRDWKHTNKFLNMIN